MRIYTAEITTGARTLETIEVHSPLNIKAVLILLYRRYYSKDPSFWYADKSISYGHADNGVEDWFCPSRRGITITQWHREDMERWAFFETLETKINTPRLTESRAL